MTRTPSTIREDRISDASATSLRSTSVLVDGHAHYHSCFDPVDFLDAALANFQRAANQQSLQTDWLGCLLLADMAGQDTLAALQTAKQDGRLDPWDIKSTEDGAALFTRGESSESQKETTAAILLIPGRQIMSAERIELLALATTEQFEESRPLRESLKQVQQDDALPVLPWSFGKWWFARGKVMRSLLAELSEYPEASESNKANPIFLGDISLRPRCFIRPSMFHSATRAGLGVLPGTDPLALPSQNQNAGRYGFVLDGPFDSRRPIESIKNTLRNLTGKPPTFGARERLVTFARDQVALRQRKRKA